MTGVSSPYPSLSDLHALGAAQQPQYPDASEVGRVVEALRRRPPLVFAGEVDELRGRIAEAAAGRAFILQAGDCAETFDNVTAVNKNSLRVQVDGAGPAVRGPGAGGQVGHIAGQYAARSSDSRPARASRCRHAGTPSMASTSTRRPG